MFRYLIIIFGLLMLGCGQSKEDNRVNKVITKADEERAKASLAEYFNESIPDIRNFEVVKYGPLTRIVMPISADTTFNRLVSETEIAGYFAQTEGEEYYERKKKGAVTRDDRKQYEKLLKERNTLLDSLGRYKKNYKGKMYYGIQLRIRHKERNEFRLDEMFFYLDGNFKFVSVELIPRFVREPDPVLLPKL